jgi:hypothetical protein
VGIRRNRLVVRGRQDRTLLVDDVRVATVGAMLACIEEED